MKIIDYMIVEDRGENDLSTMVCDYIAQGWQPFGGVSARAWVLQDTRDGEESFHCYAQALVKYAPTASGEQK